MADEIRIHKTDRLPADIGSNSFDRLHEDVQTDNHKTKLPALPAVSAAKEGYSREHVGGRLREPVLPLDAKG